MLSLLMDEQSHFLKTYEQLDKKNMFILILKVYKG